MRVNFFSNSNNQATAESLGWTKFLQLTADYLCLNYNTELPSLFPFLQSQKEINQSHDAIEALIRNEALLSEIAEGLKSISPYLDISNTVKLLSAGQVFTYREVNGICLGLEGLKTILTKLAEENIVLFPINNHEVQNFIHKHVLKIRSFVLPNFDFNLKDDHKLRSLVEKKISVTKKIQEKTGNFLRQNSTVSSTLSSLDFFDGVYLLPVSAAEYQVDFGNIEKRSNTGNTFYINLNSISALNNELNIIQSSIEKHIYVYEKLISDFLRNDLEQLEDILEILSKIDRYYAKSKICLSLGLTKQAQSNNFSIHIKSMKHPFINDYVRNSLRFGKDNQVFLITGSNYGGKSVYLKTIAFCTLLHKAGFFMSAEASEFPNIDNFFYFSGDLQDIETSESTFSAESKYYLKMIEEVDNNSIIFLDEVFSSTSSLEGSALAYGIISLIIKKYKKVKILVTTHHEMLKEFLSAKPGCTFGSFSINPSSGMPNFKLIPDKIESSRAIETFSRIFKECDDLNEIIDAAKKISQIDKKEKNQELVIHNIETNKDKMIHELESKLEDLTREFSFYKSQKIGIKRVQTDSSKNSINTVKQIHEIEESLEKKLVHDQKAASLIINQSYFSHSLQTKVKLLEICRDHLVVQKKSFRLKLPKGDLNILGQGDSEDAGHGKQATFELTSEANLRLDGRGLRLDEFIEKVEIQLNHLLTENIPYLEVIHGHGTGALKTWLLNMIKQSKDLKIEKREDGNDGATIIKLS